jgi:peptide chain release factor 2
LNDIEKELNDIKEMKEIADEDMLIEIEEKVKKLKIVIDKQETKAFLSGRYDKNGAILEISSGAGGVDAQDWATILLRMYNRYCERKNFQVKIIDQSFGEAGGPDGRIGTKSVTLEIKGKYVYGLLKKETGVHRLVRQSPFSAKKLRHTSFALVEVLPEIEKEDVEIDIKEEDLRIDHYRSSGPGGQNVNKRETAVRITHIPTNTIVASQSERQQVLNKEKAMKVLYSKLYKLKEQEREKELKDIKGGTTSASWGNQIRSYVLHPYKMIKDLRTEVESSSVEDILDGDLDQFIEAEIKNDINTKSK